MYNVEIETEEVIGGNKLLRYEKLAKLIASNGEDILALLPTASRES